MNSEIKPEQENKRPLVVVGGKHHEAKEWARREGIQDFIFATNDVHIRGMRNYDYVILGYYLKRCQETFKLVQCSQRNGRPWKKNA